MKTQKLQFLLFACLLVSGGSLAVRAQSYSIDWYKVAGGGGASAGMSGSSVYSVSGTIGQFDAGTLAGGGYSLTGGFWSINAVVQTPGAPVLSIAVVNASHVMLSWSSAFPGFSLEQETSLDNSNWVRVNTNTYPVVVNGGTNSVTLPAAGNQFFRLVNP